MLKYIDKTTKSIKEKKMARKEKNPEQIVRIDGKNCFLEVMSNSFAIDKVRINFRTYDVNAQSGNRTNGKIDIYLGYKDFDFLYQGIMHNGNGYLMSEVFNSQYGATIYRGGRKENGQVIARELKLQQGQRKPFILTAEQGPGSENSMGGFSLIRNNNANITRIMIPLELKDLVHICNSTNNAIIAYKAAAETKKILDFEFSKVKDMLMHVAGATGCNRDAFMSIMNREMPRTWQNDDNDQRSQNSQIQQDGGYGSGQYSQETRNYNQNTGGAPYDTNQYGMGYPQQYY